MKWELLAVSLLIAAAAQCQSLGDISLTTTALSPAERTQILIDLRRDTLTDLNSSAARDLLDPNSAAADDFAHHLRDALQARGYFKAEVGPITAQLSPDKSQVDIHANVKEGRVYQFGSVTLADTRILPFDIQRRAFGIHPGELFNASLIRAGLDQLKRELCARGYINGTVDPGIWTDDKTGLIYLIIKIDDGGLFRIGSLTLEGGEAFPGAGQPLLAAWQSLEGKPYTCGDNLAAFLRERRDLLPNDFVPQRDVHADASPGNHTLNFRIARP